jgi:hypothetical protein
MDTTGGLYVGNAKNDNRASIKDAAIRLFGWIAAFAFCSACWWAVFWAFMEALEKMEG